MGETQHMLPAPDNYQYEFNDIHHIKRLSQITNDSTLLISPTSLMATHTRRKQSITKEQQLTEFEKMYMGTKLPLKTISSIYAALPTKQALKEHNFIKAWEKEIHKTFTEPEWERMILTPKTFSLSSKHIELVKKLLYRWYLMPVRLHNYNPAISTHCWRFKTSIGTMAHIWWTCPLLEQYWKDIAKLIKDSTGNALPHRLELYVLFDIPGSIPKPDRYLMFHINIVALGALVRNWISQTIPPISMCIRHISISSRFETTMRRQNTPPTRTIKNTDNIGK
ncbi:Hypothetical predicted protein [Pelobates cultripes]|uniref:Reverse transcriptase zinc-binding domain-containing protein n=1 Tax=Pelobates cultripes TaxID=61616 RepID=A0AAD1S0U9_PELCU|nr:Hypothetical predicted protein [Pelobates cultripes]